MGKTPKSGSLIFEMIVVFAIIRWKICAVNTINTGFTVKNLIYKQMLPESPYNNYGEH